MGDSASKEAGDDDEISRVMRQYLEAFIFTLLRPEEGIIEIVLNLIDPLAKEKSVLANTEFKLTEVCKVQFAQYILKLCSHLSLGDLVSGWVDDRLAENEFADNELATLFLLVREQEIADEIAQRNEEGKGPVWKDFKFYNGKPDLEWIRNLAIAKAFLAHYSNDLIQKKSKCQNCNDGNFRWSIYD